MNSFSLRSQDGSARRGTLTLHHGSVETPAFMPVGTAASVKGLWPDQVREIGSQIVLANTYHLWLRPGRDALESAGGLHRFMNWPGPILTDSGGFQVFSLEARRTVDDDGVTFASHLDGSMQRFTPETVLAFQEAIGVDVAMVLDVCVKLPATYDELAAAVRLTTAWAQRSAAARARSETLVFAIVQGGLDESLRAQSARELVVLDLPGYAIGGLSVGETREELYATAAFTARLLPPERPRYLMGVGTVRDLLMAVDCGIDMFDCVYPTRCGRNARAITLGGEFNMKSAQFRADERPIDPHCACKACAGFSRAYVSYLFRANEMLAAQLLSYHNVYTLNRLMGLAREAIEAGRWAAFRDSALNAAGA
ncbi:MAG: tRNA guanosine(34) transglycosylase Tgt [Candidatus Eremiobacteraeota bacterium]|nr:tRNA guanosine(34) transglycosylase Tgt [Candidatus Eremiobacteraeota bacterium]